MATTTITVSAQGYVATMTGYPDAEHWCITISTADGAWCGDGEWDVARDEIVGCAADLGDEVYDAIEMALAGAIADAECEECEVAS